VYFASASGVNEPAYLGRWIFMKRALKLVNVASAELTIYKICVFSEMIILVVYQIIIYKCTLPSWFNSDIETFLRKVSTTFLSHVVDTFLKNVSNAIRSRSWSYYKRGIVGVGSSTVEYWEEHNAEMGKEVQTWGI
jgi:hypothetical protein